MEPKNEKAIQVTQKPVRRTLTFPRGLSGKGHFSFNDKEKSAIILILGEDHFQGVEVESISYLLHKQYDSFNPVGLRNKELLKIKHHVEALVELLEDQGNANHLLNNTVELFGDDICRKIAKGPWTQKTSLEITDHLKLIKMVCTIFDLRLKDQPGRPKGTKNKAEYWLLNQLYYRCQLVNGGHLTTKPNNLLERVVKILSQPLGFGGYLPGITRKVIEQRSSKG
ncbi:MAG: hypothetical protein OEL83_18370 [Desulforhopalus sp.]|nr:hypothetical protein [Desulforhopalus sp.]